MFPSGGSMETNSFVFMVCRGDTLHSLQIVFDTSQPHVLTIHILRPDDSKGKAVTYVAVCNFDYDRGCEGWAELAKKQALSHTRDTYAGWSGSIMESVQQEHVHICLWLIGACTDGSFCSSIEKTLHSSLSSLCGRSKQTIADKCSDLLAGRVAIIWDGANVFISRL
ncbi:hypothetical protein PROFUN_12077 [Planoprotostelium fungivorum]|uniref:Uncharacterized protein n=1 Tax=Planoprotostelium fungivorum TaxID=1890364 RepID=A0A2P6N8Q4_9EUKA|nr:hypothetical protein PROFUN_12077 [Planoprotostelium fungivorum]